MIIIIIIIITTTTTTATHHHHLYRPGRGIGAVHLHVRVPFARKINKHTNNPNSHTNQANGLGLHTQLRV